MKASRVLTAEQVASGIVEAHRIIRDAVGYNFGGEVVPFAPEFKALALDAIDQVYQTVKEKSEDESDKRDRAYKAAEQRAAFWAPEVLGTSESHREEYIDAAIDAYLDGPTGG
jgi:hypothetical protein